jgi:hypothetical protein
MLEWGICKGSLPLGDSLWGGVEDDSARWGKPMSDRLALEGESLVVEPSDDRFK